MDLRGGEPGSLPRSGRPSDGRRAGCGGHARAADALPRHHRPVSGIFVDALGGVTIRITEEIPIGQDGRVLQPGLRRLDGYETLWYARSRAASSDYARMSRQRCVLGAILHEADPATVLRNFTSLAAASTSVVSTNIPQDQLPDLVDMALTAKDLPITTLQLVPPLIDPADPDPSAIDEQLELAIEASLDQSDVGVSVAAGDATPGRRRCRRGAARSHRRGRRAQPEQCGLDERGCAGGRGPQLGLRLRIGFGGPGKVHAVRDWPSISAIMPVLNEERHLAEAVAGVLDQDYPGDLELVLALGPSHDGTASTSGTAGTRPRVRLIDNPVGMTPNGLNAAIAVARHGIIVRVDAHGVLSPDYLGARSRSSR